ncbi:MAG: zinc ribbon domain-containing protein [Terriglobales bacterium]
MDHTCHQCGQEIEPGTPFCRNCGAPQIRVAIDEPPATPPMPPGTPDDAQPPAVPVTVGAAPPPPRPGLDWSNALPAAIWTGAILAISWIVPYSGYFLWIIAAGILAVALYRRRTGNAPLTRSNGARIGAVCGLFGFVGFSGMLAVGLLLLRGSTKFREIMQAALRQAAANNPDPQAQQMLAKMTSPAGLAVLVTLVLIFFLACFIALGSAGGAIGAWMFSPKKNPPQQ